MSDPRRDAEVERAEADTRKQQRAARLQGLHIAAIEATAEAIARRADILGEHVADLLRGQTT